MLRLDAVLAREQDPGLLQNDELRARAERDCEGAGIGDRSGYCYRVVPVND